MRRIFTLLLTALALAVGVGAGVALAENLTGTNGPDTLIGTPQEDTIRGPGGADTIKGKGDIDELFGGSGGDVVGGGTAGDFIQGAGGDDELRGGGGAEVRQEDETTTVMVTQLPGEPGIEAGFGDDTVFGGGGNDFIYVSGDQANGNQDEVFCGSGEATEDFVLADDNDIFHGDCIRVKQLPQSPAELFDVVGARLSHHGEDCSFETFLKEYELDDPVLCEIAEILHDADLMDEKYGRAESEGLDSIVRGMQLALDDDEILTSHTDSLYAYLGREVL